MVTVSIAGRSYPVPAAVVSPQAQDHFVVVAYVLDTMQQYEPRIKFTEDAALLVARTAYPESGLKYWKQIGGGPGRSFWQVEPATAYDLYDRYVLRKDLQAALNEVAGGPVDKSNLIAMLELNRAVGAFFCRLKYRDDPDPIPSGLVAQAHYWKRVYNTRLGAGKPEDFIAACKRGGC